MRILITGSNGLLGQALVHKLKSWKEIQLTAASLHDSLLPVEGFSFECLDISHPASVKNIFEKYRPETVIHTAAQTQVDFCELHREECLRVNVEGTKNILQACEQTKSHLIHLSTDFIFDGASGPYLEEDAPAPVSFYGKSKLMAEEIVRSAQTPWTILRTILVFGSARSNFVHWVVRSLQKEETIRVVSDQIRMPTWNEDLADGCISAALKSKTGVYHVSGADQVSIFEFAKQIAEVFDLDASLILPIASAELKQPARRPLKTGFVLEKAKRELQYQPHSLVDALRHTAL